MATTLFDKNPMGIDFNKYKPKLSNQVHVPKSTEAQKVQKTVQPKTLQPQVSNKQGLVSRAFNALAVPEQKLQEFVTGGRGYEKLYEEAGVQSPGIRKGLSIGTSFGLDPLNAIPFGKIGSIAGKVGSKIDDITKVSKIVRETPLIQKIAKPATKFISKFKKGYGIPDDVVDTFDNALVDVEAKAEKALQSNAIRYKNLGKKEIEYVAKALDATTSKKIKEVSKIANTFDANVKKRLDAIVNTERGISKKQILEEIRRGFPSSKAIKKYFPHQEFEKQKNLIKRLYDNLQFSVKKSYLGKRSGKEGYSLNAPKVLFNRELQQFKANAIQDSFKFIKKKYGVPIKTVRDVPEGYVGFTQEGLKALYGDSTKGINRFYNQLKDFKGVALPENIAEYIGKVVKKDSDNVITKSMKSFNKYWKPLSTSVNPAFYFQNIVGNPYNAWLGGMSNPKRYAQSILGGVIPKLFSKGEREIIKKLGVEGHGQFTGDLMNRTFDSAYEGATVKNTVQKLLEYPKRFSSNIENAGRNALALDKYDKLIKKGKVGKEEITQIRKHVNKYLFDYLNGLTPEEQKLKVYIPFYTWARKNIPLQFESMVKQPQKVSKVSIANRELNEGNEQNLDKMGITIPTGVKDKEGRELNYRPPLPTQDIFDLGPRKFIGMVNPLIKEFPQIALWLASSMSGGKFVPFDLYSGKQRTIENLPFTEQLRDVAGGTANSLVRPLRSISRVDEEGSGSDAWLRSIMGGWVRKPTTSDAESSVYKQNATRGAIKKRIQQILNSKSLDENDKRDIDRLRSKLQ